VEAVDPQGLLLDGGGAVSGGIRNALPSRSPGLAGLRGRATWAMPTVAAIAAAIRPIRVIVFIVVSPQSVLLAELYVVDHGSRP